MHLLRFTDVGRFLGRAESFLVEHEAEHGLILGICATLLQGGLTEHPPYLAVVEEGPDMLLDSGRKFCFLYTDVTNPTSNHIYQEIGYRPVADLRLYVFGHG
jgi:hypothetical protein